MTQAISAFKLGIVIPLKARAVSADWERVCANLANTLASITQQSNVAYQCVVVGHDDPHLPVHFLATDIDVPQVAELQGQALRLAYEKDRSLKVILGLDYLAKTDCSHFFALDADDLLHQDFVQHLSQFDLPQSFIIKHGYMHYVDKQMVNPTQEFDVYCGSCAVISKATLNACLAKQHYFYDHIAHCDFQHYFEQQQVPYTIPSQSLMMYVRDNGENISALDNERTHLSKLWYRCKREVLIYIRAVGQYKLIMTEFGIKG